MRVWLRELRNSKGLKMKELAERLGISESYYSAIESGERQKTMDLTLAAGLAVILEIPVADIVREEQALKLEVG